LFKTFSVVLKFFNEEKFSLILFSCSFNWDSITFNLCILKEQSSADVITLDVNIDKLIFVSLIQVSTCSNILFTSIRFFTEILTWLTSCWAEPKTVVNVFSRHSFCRLTTSLKGFWHEILYFFTNFSPRLVKEVILECLKVTISSRIVVNSRSCFNKWSLLSLLGEAAYCIISALFLSSHFSADCTTS